MKRNNFFRPKQKGHPNQLGCPFLCLKGVREDGGPFRHGCAVPAPAKVGAKSRLPLWGALVPSGHRSALGLRCRVGRCWTSATGRQHPSRQARVPSLGGRRGQAPGKPSSRCPTGRERRFAVSLVSFPALRAYKGKVEAFLKRKRVRPADVPQKTLRSLRSAYPLRARALFS